MKSGKGVLKLTDGRSFEGDWKNDKLITNVPYTIHWPDGSTFTGIFQGNGLRHGKGTQVLSNGFVYEGEWKNDQMIDGAIKDATGKEFYKGKLVDGRKEGYGVSNFADGSCYRGNWKNGKLHG